jgi:hypothetical protein
MRKAYLQSNKGIENLPGYKNIKQLPSKMRSEHLQGNKGIEHLCGTKIIEHSR